MGRQGWGELSTEQAALLEVVDQVATRWRPRDADHVEVADARAALVRTGLWGLGVPEAAGGAGADHATAQLAVAMVSAHWPALGVAMAHLHAAAAGLDPGLDPAPDPALDRTPRREDLARAVDGGRPIAVVSSGGDEREPVRLARVDVGALGCDLVLLRAAAAVWVPGEKVEFGPPTRRTGLDGALGVPATVPAGMGEALGDVADAVRTVLFGGMLAVAAGIAVAAEEHARNYAGSRVQFGGPLTALPPVRERLATVRGRAATLLAAATRRPSSVEEAAAVLRTGVETAVSVSGAALRVFGGYGYLEEYPLAGLYRDAISLRAACGSF